MNAKIKNKVQNNSKNSLPYPMFFPRKGQITISFLLIFLILFSTFSIGLIAEREMWASAKFRGAVDAAALSAGADMAKAADLIIALTSIRFLLFTISRILYIISLPMPILAAAANSFNTIAKNTSTILYKISTFVPLAYLVKAEIDAYNTFSENFGKADQNISDWSLTDYALVVIPNYSLNNLSNLNIFPELTNLENSTEFIREGFSVFSYRKYSYLEQIKTKFNINDNTFSNTTILPTEFKKWLESHDVFVSSSKIAKTKESGIDLSDAVKISNFLNNYWEGSDNSSLPEKSENNVFDDLKSVLNEIRGFPEFIKQNTFYCNYKDGSPNDYPFNTYYNNKDLYATNDEIQKVENMNVSSEIFDNDKRELLNILHNWVNFVRGQKNAAGEAFLNYARQSEKYADELEGLINEYDALIKELEKGNITNLDEDSIKKLGTIKDQVMKIKGQIDSAITTLESNFPPDSYKYKKTCISFDESGAAHAETCYDIEDLRLTKSYMKSAKVILTNISNECNSLVNKIEETNKKSDEKLKNGIESAKKILEKTLGDLKGLAGSLKGLPGGNTLAYVFGKYDCNTVDDGCGPSSLMLTSSLSIPLPNNGAYCGIPFIGNLLCAITKDLNLGLTLINGENFQFISYYSARLEKPPFLDTKVVAIAEENSNLTTLVDNISKNIKESLVIKEEPNDIANQVLFSLAGSVITGILSGGTTVIIGGILNVLTETALVPLVKNTIGDLVIPQISDTLIGYINQCKSQNSTVATYIGIFEEALGKFIDTYNYVQDFKLKIIGLNDDVPKFNLCFLLLVDSLNFKVAPNNQSFVTKTNNEKNYLLEKN